MACVQEVYTHRGAYVCADDEARASFEALDRHEAQRSGARQPTPARTLAHSCSTYTRAVRRGAGRASEARARACACTCTKAQNSTFGRTSEAGTASEARRPPAVARGRGDAAPAAYASTDEQRARGKRGYAWPQLQGRTCELYTCGAQSSIAADEYTSQRLACTT